MEEVRRSHKRKWENPQTNFVHLLILPKVNTIPKEKKLYSVICLQTKGHQARLVRDWESINKILWIQLAPAGITQLVGGHPITERLLVQFLVRAHDWVAGSVLAQGA